MRAKPDWWAEAKYLRWRRRWKIKDIAKHFGVSVRGVEYALLKKKPIRNKDIEVKCKLRSKARMCAQDSGRPVELYYREAGCQ